MKRILCTLLLCCLLGALSVPAFADTGGTQIISLHIPYTVTVDVGQYGKVYVNKVTYTGAAVGSFKVEPGTKLSFLVTPNSGYEVSALTRNGKSVLTQLKSGLYVTTVNEDVRLVVRFAKTASPTPVPVPSRPPTPGPNPPYGPRTSDESRLGLWSALLLTSAGGLAALSQTARRRGESPCAERGAGV